MKDVKMKLYQSISEYCDARLTEWDLISEQRKDSLLVLSNALANSYKKNKTICVTIICTHNSRRSHFGQLWLAIAAAYFGFENIETFSGGTEATAVFKGVMQAMQNSGCVVETGTIYTEQQEYLLKWTDEQKPLTLFSKRFEDEANPSEHFIAVMVCSDADETCPYVPGCDFRIAIPYQDPKRYDGSPEEQNEYDICCAVIAREMLFVMKQFMDM